MEPSDAELISASWSTSASFAAIFDRHYDTVHAYLTRRLGPELADDLASETFIVAFESRQRYDISRPDARPWLLGIATNLLRHHHRKEARRLRAYARLDRSGAVTDETAAADARLDAGRLASALVDALVRLSREDRDVLLLFAWADLSYDEIAVALRIPIGTVRSRLHRARRRMREPLSLHGQYGVDAMKETEADG